MIARVAGAGHDSPAEARNLVPDFPHGDSCEVPMVGLLHTYVTGAKSAESHDRYAPCSKADLESRNYAYWALGHVHTQQKVEGDLDAWYPGVLQGRHPGETGSKGGLIVSVSDHGFAEVEFRPFSSVVWETLTLDKLAEVANLSDLRALVVSAFEERCGTGPPSADWILRILLEGPCPLARTLSDNVELETLQEDLQSLLDARFVEVRTRSLTPLVDVNRFRGDVHVLSEILKLIEEAEDNDQLLQALSPRILAGPVDEFSSSTGYLRELLAGLDYEAVSRLVELDDAH
jgi:DNA repair exonuclease SbcCD nuclease subunit